MDNCTKLIIGIDQVLKQPGWQLSPGMFQYPCAQLPVF